MMDYLKWLARVVRAQVLDLPWRLMARVPFLRERVLRPRFVEPALGEMLFGQPGRRDFKSSYWIYGAVTREPETLRPGPGQWISCNVVLLGPDGRLISVPDLKLRTGQRWNLEDFQRRLAAEINRLIDEGVIPRIPRVSSYVKSSTIAYTARLVRMVRIEAPKGR